MVFLFFAEFFRKTPFNAYPACKCLVFFRMFHVEAGNGLPFRILKSYVAKHRFLEK
jgi:hypothetical protein